MPLVEIEDQYIAQLQSMGIPASDRTADFTRAREHEAFLANVGKDPKHRTKLLELIADTGVYVPEVSRVREAKDELTGMLTERLKPLDDFLAKQQEREESERTRSTQKLVEDGRSYLRQQGWDDAGVAEVETFMRDHAVGDYSVASAHLKRQKPDPTPLPTTSWNGNDLGNSWFNAPDDAPDHKLLLSNPQAFKNQEIRRFFKEKAEGKLARY